MLRVYSRTRPRTVGSVAGLDDVAVVGQAIEQRGGHLGVAEDARPFAEGEVGGDDDGGAFELVQNLAKVCSAIDNRRNPVANSP